MNNNYSKYFTETDNGLDIEANNINANCITSQSNKFSLDSDGNINNGKLNVLITDYYDFKLETGYYDGSIFKTIALTGNNLAYLDQCTGVINKYYIYVNLEYEVE